MRRKAGAARPGPVLAVMTPKKAMRFAVARAAEQALGCAVAPTDLSESRGSPEDLIAALPEPCLLLRLEACSPAGMAVGLAAFCPQAVAAMIEAQTMGRVLSGAAADRRPTGTDAMLVTEFLDTVLIGFAALSADCPEPPPVAGFVSRGRIADLRAAILTLRDAEHVHYVAGLDFANGAKTGALHLLLPSVVETTAPGAGPSDFTLQLRGMVLGSPAWLEAVLCRPRLSLSRVTALKAGDLLPLDSASLDRVALCGPDGTEVLTARLGRSGPARALRLTLDGAEPAQIAQGPGGADAGEAPDAA